MKTNKKVIMITALTTICLVIVFGTIIKLIQKDDNRQVRVGYIYQGDASTPYNRNFIRVQREIEQRYGDRVQSVEYFNIGEETMGNIYEDLIASKCDIVFANSYEFCKTIKEWAKANPSIQFCSATGDNANVDEHVENFHNYMGTIYEGRYVAGVIAGAKLQELIRDGKIKREDAKIGYVAAFPYAEVISGYTAFFMGVYSQVPEVTMEVVYVDSWSDYSKEKDGARQLIENGCVVISQHSDTIGPAVVCQELSNKYPVYHVGYNGSMMDVAPTTSLVSCKINWEPYEMTAVEAVFEDKKIEAIMDATTNGNDAWAGFDKGWVEILGLNEFIAPEGAEELMEETIKRLKRGEINVFSGPFTGTNPFDETDRIDLSKEPFVENRDLSAPQFHYVLDDVIKIVD